MNRVLVVVTAAALVLGGLSATGCTSSGETAFQTGQTPAAAVPSALPQQSGQRAAEQPRAPRAPAASRTPQEIRAEAAEHIKHFHSITLTPQQERIKQDALSALPAPCCSNYSAATCCCPCNLAKAIWGLTHQLIAEQGAGVDEVRVAVQEWLADANPAGFSGNVCYTAGGCERPFHQNGCGSMEERNLL